MSDISESNYRGTGCGKAARPDLWGSGEVTIRSTRTWILFTTKSETFIVLSISYRNSVKEDDLATSKR
jgi:hypothetical protein